MLSQRSNVFAAIPQRRHLNGEHREAVVQILAESSCFGFDRQVPVGGGYQSDVHRPRAAFSHALKLPFLNHPKKLGLQLQRDLADLVQEDCAAVREFKPAHAVLNGSGKRTSDVTEELALKQLFWNSGAVDTDQRSCFAGTEIMNGACH